MPTSSIHPSRGRLATAMPGTLAIALTGLIPLLSTASPAAATPSHTALRFTAARGDRSEAQLVLRRRGNLLELLTRGGTLLRESPLEHTSGVVVDGADGHIDNTLTVNLAGGSMHVAGGIRYDGGHGGYNTLVLTGGDTSDETSTPSGPHSGTMVVDQTHIDYTDIAPITDTTPSASFTFDLPSTGGPVLIDDGPLVGGLQTLTISGEGFESTTVAQKAAITINGTGGTSSFAGNVPLASAGLTKLTINGTADAANTAVLQAIPPGVSAEYIGAAGDAVTVGGSGDLQSIAGNLSIAGSGALALDDSADTTARTVEVGPTQVSGLSPNAITYTHTSQLIVEGGMGSDTFDVTPSASTIDSVSGGGPAPPAFPGDQLLLELAGAQAPALLGTSTAAGAQGAWLFANRQPVSFSGIDSLAPTGASISDATVNPGQSAIAPTTFTVDLLAPTTAPVQLPFATADGTATAAAGNYQTTSGMLAFSPGETSKSLTVNVPGTTVAGPTSTFSVDLSSAAGAEILRGHATGTILNTNLATAPTNSSSTPTNVTSAPRITSVRQSASIWREGNHLPRISARRPPVGSTVSFVLSEQATAKLTFSRSAPGRRVGSRCVAQNHADRSAAHCTRIIAAGTLSLAGKQGINRVFFDGRLSAATKLATGHYTLSILATNPQGQRSAPAGLSFTIIK
jgi:hypothetical protein